VGMYILLFKQTTRHTEMKLSLPLIEQSNTHTSDTLDISFVLPENYTITESGNFITLILDHDVINIDRIGTNYSDVTNHINALEKKNNLNIINRKIIAGKYDIIRTNIINPNNREDDELVYFIYPDQWTIYTLSTTSPELYDDLEEIVQSFEYLGE
jgi:hypothetical protein